MARALAYPETADRIARAFMRAAGEPRSEGSGADSLHPSRALARVLPVDRIAAAAFVALGILATFGNDRARVTSGTHQVRLPHDAPRVRSLTADLDIAFRNPNLHVVHVEDYIVLRGTLDDAIPRPTAEALAFGALPATACPPDVRHASPVRVPEWRLAARRDTSFPRT